MPTHEPPPRQHHFPFLIPHRSKASASRSTGPERKTTLHHLGTACIQQAKHSPKASPDQSYTNDVTTWSRRSAVREVSVEHLSFKTPVDPSPITTRAHRRQSRSTTASAAAGTYLVDDDRAVAKAACMVRTALVAQQEVPVHPEMARTQYTRERFATGRMIPTSMVHGVSISERYTTQNITRHVHATD